MRTRWLTNINECRVDEEKDDRMNDVDELVGVDMCDHEVDVVTQLVMTADTRHASVTVFNIMDDLTLATA